jgi:hypothetical protein
MRVDTIIALNKTVRLSQALNALPEKSESAEIRKVSERRNFGWMRNLLRGDSVSNQDTTKGNFERMMRT